MKTRALLSLALLSGCALTPGEPEPAPAAAPEDVRYTIELASARPLVRIHVDCTGDSDGETELAVEEPGGGVAEPGKDLELVGASAAGQALACERLATWRWRVRHARGLRITATFELGSTPHRADPDPRIYYQPILEPGLLHLIGSNALPAPEHLDPGEERAIRLEWRGFAEAGWGALSSFGMGEEPLERRSSLDGFRHALFLAGELELFERDVHGAPLCVAVYGTEWTTPLEDFADLCASIVAMEREFFGEFTRPFYLISLIPVGKREPGVVSMGGTGLTDSFALFLLPGSSLGAAYEGGMSIPWLLAHEMFHDWNGHAIRLAQPERAGYWFSEGFTDFYARRLLQRAGLLSLEDHARSWNEKFSAYATNPERNSPASRIQEAFWSDRDVGNLPYQRGDLVALLVDEAIRRRSGGAQSLDDLVRELVRRARDGEEEFTVDELLAALEEFAGRETAETVRAVVVDGAEVELPPDAGLPELELATVDIPRFDTGFDHEHTVSAGVVSGVRPGSPAEAAGLRDGMKALGWSVAFGRTDRPIEVRVRDGQEERTISFLPAGETVRAYRFAVRDR